MVEFLNILNELMQQRRDEVDAWFAESYQGRRVPIYSSVDVRNAGFKLAPVDTNLFPAGFNNLNEASMARAVDAMKRHVARMDGTPKKLLLMSENHTRNRPYFDNVANIVALCEAAGLEVRIGRFDLDEGQTMQVETTAGAVLTAEAIHLDGEMLVSASGFVPDMVLVNNDLSSGCPEILCDVQQPVFPPPGMGWYRRRKSVHFDAYNQIAREFASHFELDVWLFSTVIHRCGKINFKERKGMECVAIGVDKAIHAIGKKYAEYGIKRAPYVYVKADSGTYGMGIMTAYSGDEVFELNKKTRSKMNVIKEGVENTEVIIQEGVPTSDMIEGAVAEPMLYLVGSEPVGKIWRVNEGRSEENSLNASGMRFQPFDEAEFARHAGLDIVGRLATLASAYEHYDKDPCGKDVL